MSAILRLGRSSSRLLSRTRSPWTHAVSAISGPGRLDIFRTALRGIAGKSPSAEGVGGFGELSVQPSAADAAVSSLEQKIKKLEIDIGDYKTLLLQARDKEDKKLYGGLLKSYNENLGKLYDEKKLLLEKQSTPGGPRPALLDEVPNLAKKSFETEETGTNMLRSLNNMQKGDIIDIGAEIKAYNANCMFAGIKIGPQLVYVRPFYDKLLSEIRKISHVVLVGNPGIGKSTFQYYYLARILNPKLFGELPPDCFGNTAPPKFVLREVENEMQLYDINRQEAWEIVNYRKSIFKCFNPRETLYLVEPGLTLKQPLTSGMVPTLATVSPDVSRYHEFVKSGATKLFMPKFKKEELLAIGKYLRDHDLVPNSMKADYEDDKISERFERFGGIIRHVLPTTEGSKGDSERKQLEAISTCDVGKLLRTRANIEMPEFSHYLLQYEVLIDGDKPFAEFQMDLASDFVEDQLTKRMNESSVYELSQALIQNDETGYLNDSIGRIFENWVFKSLTSVKGVKWKKQAARRGEARRGDDDGSWEPFKLRLSPERAAAPSYADMKPDVLYYSNNPNYPFADLVFKENDEEGTLVLIQVTRQREGKKQQVASSAMLLLERLGLQDSYESVPIKVVLVPGPQQCKSLTLALLDFDKGNKKVNQIAKENEEGLVTKFAEYEVWAVPKNYSFEP